MINYMKQSSDRSSRDKRFLKLIFFTFEFLHWFRLFPALISTLSSAHLYSALSPTLFYLIIFNYYKVDFAKIKQNM